MTPEEKREFMVARINSFLFVLKHMHGDELMASAYARLQERLISDESTFSQEEEKNAYRRLIRNLILFLVDLKGQNTEEKDIFDEMLADLL